jgi:hypothetical protein
MRLPYIYLMTVLSDIAKVYTLLKGIHHIFSFSIVLDFHKKFKFVSEENKPSQTDSGFPETDLHVHIVRTECCIYWLRCRHGLYFVAF